jgi:signal transduction histidine kinase
VLARESALALKNIHLEGELRQRLEQIERQAVELRSSRQRLVAAQDSERRRIERDLHDGAQQQLVALAARLRRAAHADEPQVAEELAGLADEAEDAVFTLQELARGIYPSLLADRGLHAALQVHAARLPVLVRIDVGPTLHGRRLTPELEAALYNVAMEAMTNAVKHAPGASISLVLRSGDTGRSVVLEVHDDGAGFDAGSTSGRGIQNMTDRIDAVGGAFSVESVPGAGTWVRVEVTEPAGVTDIRSGAASPAGRSAPRPPAG